MKKARKLFCTVISVFFLMSLAACGNTAQVPDKAEDVSESESTDAGIDNSESRENGEQQNGNGFNGGGMGDRMQGGNGGSSDFQPSVRIQHRFEPNLYYWTVYGLHDIPLSEQQIS